MFSVVMATYNGMPWVVEQIDSLAKQTLLPSELIIADDGSTDGTIAAIEDMRAKLPFPVTIHQNPERLGYADNFLSAAELASQPYICFCDQDDVWLPNKLETYAALIKAHPAVSLFIHQAEIVDQKLQKLGANHPVVRETRLQPPLAANVLHRPPGFSMAFSRELVTRHDFRTRPADFEFRSQPSKHDTWIMTLANAEGGIYYTTDNLALYRRHDNNASFFRPGTNATRRLGQMRDVLKTPSMTTIEIQAQAYREHANYFDAKSKSAPSNVDAERYRALAAQYRRGADLAAHRLRHYHSKLGNRVALFAKALRNGMYRDNNKINRRMVLQDFSSLFSLSPPVKR
jgi:glycosyltransferase involved in cell wall biosynthesis